MMTYEQAREIAKARGPWNEALHPRDHRGRFSKRLTLVDALRRTNTSGSVRDVIVAPRRNPLARTGPADSPIRDESRTLPSMTTPSKTRTTIKAGKMTPGIMIRNRRIGGAVTPEYPHADGAWVEVGQVVNTRGRNRSGYANHSAGQYEILDKDEKIITRASPRTEFEMRTKAEHERLTRPHTPEPESAVRTLADARAERDQVDAKLMRLGSDITGPHSIHPADATTRTALRARAAELDTEIRGMKAMTSQAATKLPEPAAPKVPDVETQTKVKDLKVGDRIKSYVDFIPEGKITRAPQRGQSGYDYDISWGDGKPERQYDGGDRWLTVLSSPEPDATPRESDERSRLRSKLARAERDNDMTSAMFAREDLGKLDVAENGGSELGLDAHPGYTTRSAAFAGELDKLSREDFEAMPDAKREAIQGRARAILADNRQVSQSFRSSRFKGSRGIVSAPEVEQTREAARRLWAPAPTPPGPKNIRDMSADELREYASATHGLYIPPGVTKRKAIERIEAAQKAEKVKTDVPTPATPVAPKRLTGMQLMALVNNREGKFSSHGKRDDAKREMVAAGLGEQDADDQLTELGVAPGQELNYSIISRSQSMAQAEYTESMRAATPKVFAGLLAAPGEKGALTHKPSRQVVEDLQANGWDLVASNSMMGNAEFEAPNGTRMTLTLPRSEGQNPYFSGKHGKITYKAARERAAAGSVMPEVPKPVEVDPYADRVVPALDIKVGDEYKQGNEWKRVGQILSRRDGGIELHDGTMNWDSRISTISGPSMIGPHATWRATVRTPRPDAPEPHPVDERAESRGAQLAAIDADVASGRRQDATQARIDRAEIAIRRHADARKMNANEPDDERWMTELRQSESDLGDHGVTVEQDGTYRLGVRGGATASYTEFGAPDASVGRVGDLREERSHLSDELNDLSDDMGGRRSRQVRSRMEAIDGELEALGVRKPGAGEATPGPAASPAPRSVAPVAPTSEPLPLPKGGTGDLLAGLSATQMLERGTIMHGTDRRKWPASAQAALARAERAERGVPAVAAPKAKAPKDATVKQGKPSNVSWVDHLRDAASESDARERLDLAGKGKRELTGVAFAVGLRGASGLSVADLRDKIIRMTYGAAEKARNLQGL